MASTPKQQLVDELVTAFRTSGNQDNALDNLAADRLGINRTDLLCLNTIENSGGLTAGQIATHTGLTTGAGTGGINRPERAGCAHRRGPRSRHRGARPPRPRRPRPPRG